MPGIYPQSGNIGALLRLIEQERKAAPHAVTPLADPSAPMRKSVAAPLESPIAPESPGTGRVVSIRPEAAPTGAGPAGVIAPTTGKMGQIGGPIVPPTTYTPSAVPSPVSPGESRPSPTQAQAQEAPRVVQPTTYAPKLATRISAPPSRRDIGSPMEEAEAAWAGSQAKVDQAKRGLADATRRYKTAVSAGAQQTLYRGRPSQPRREPTPRWTAPKKKFSLAKILKPIISWFSRR